MASVYKRTRRKPTPKSAEIVESRGKRFAVWRSRGRRRRTSGGPDKDAAVALGRKLEAEKTQRRRGLIDPRQERLADAGRRDRRVPHPKLFPSQEMRKAGKLWRLSAKVAEKGLEPLLGKTATGF